MIEGNLREMGGNRIEEAFHRFRMKKMLRLLEALSGSNNSAPWDPGPLGLQLEFRF